MTDYEKIILELREEIKQSGVENKRLQLLINDLIKSNDELQQKLAYYENPHSPPSQNSLQWRKQKTEKRQNRDGESNRGGIPGHKGATQKFIPQRVQHHELFACPKCHGTSITQIKTKKRIMVSIPPPQQYEVTEHILHKYSCQTCNVTFQNDGNLPSQGSFDGSVIRNVVGMFSKRMPYDAIRASLQEQNGLHITNTTVQSILQTGQVLLEPFYEEISHKINTSDVAGFDETGYSVDGRSAWMWVARTDTEAQYVLEYGRGAKILKKYWRDFKGILISDGWKSYVTVFCKNKRQRCTAHLQRESKDVAHKSKDPSAVILYGEFSEILSDARIYCTSNHCKTHRTKYADYLSEKIDGIIKRYLDGDDVMASFGEKMKTAQNSLFTFVIHPDVPSTNNYTECSIRKCVMQRNVRGQAKSNAGMRMLAVFLTCFETWRIRGQNMLSEMAKYI
ncbi:MAG: IS66 family transposase [Nitrosotalea sp.]